MEDLVRTLKRLQNWRLTDDDCDYIESANEGTEIPERAKEPEIDDNEDIQ